MRKHLYNKPLYNISKNFYLADEEKITTYKLAEEAGADYVKTSTGFRTGGATIHNIELMYKTVGVRLGVKADGGIINLKATLDVIRAGATRIGVTQTERIMESWGNPSRKRGLLLIKDVLKPYIK